MPGKDHDDLERELRELASRIEYPPTPDVARSVRNRLDAGSARGRSRRGVRALASPRWAAAAALVLLLFLAVLPLAMRSTVSGFAHSGAGGGAGQASGGAGASGASPDEYATDAAPEPGPEGASGDGAAASSAAGTGTPPGADLGLGERLSTSEARARVGRLLLPDSPELASEPEYFCAQSKAYCAGGSSGAGVVLIFGPETGLPPMGNTDVGLLLLETPGALDDAYGLAGSLAGTHREEVTVGGRRGYWIPDGRSLTSQPGEAERLPGGALLWEQEGVALLMRADVTREEAIRIAETVR